MKDLLATVESKLASVKLAAPDQTSPHWSDVALLTEFRDRLADEIERRAGEPQPSAVVVVLKEHLAILRINEPINRAEGNIAQADLELRDANEIERFLAFIGQS